MRWSWKNSFQKLFQIFPRLSLHYKTFSYSHVPQTNNLKYYGVEAYSSIYCNQRYDIISFKPSWTNNEFAKDNKTTDQKAVPYICVHLSKEFWRYPVKSTTKRLLLLHQTNSMKTRLIRVKLGPSLSPFQRFKYDEILSRVSILLV